MNQFTKAKQEFDVSLGMVDILPHSLVTVDGKPKDNIVIRNAKHEPSEEYYKWQFIYALINSGLSTGDSEFGWPNRKRTVRELDVFENPQERYCSSRSYDH